MRIPCFGNLATDLWCNPPPVGAASGSSLAIDRIGRQLQLLLVQGPGFPQKQVQNGVPCCPSLFQSPFGTQNGPRRVDHCYNTLGQTHTHHSLCTCLTLWLESAWFGVFSSSCDLSSGCLSLALVMGIKPIIILLPSICSFKFDCCPLPLFLYLINRPDSHSVAVLSASTSTSLSVRFWVMWVHSDRDFKLHFEFMAKLVCKTIVW